MVTRKPVLIALLMGMLLLAGAANGQIIRVWRGPITFDWATFTNWEPTGDPANNRLRWTGSGLATSNNNTPVGTTFRSMEFSGVIPYTIGGNSIILVDNSPLVQGFIMDSSTVRQNINAQVEFNDDSRFGFIGKAGKDTLAMSKIVLGNSLSSLRISTDSVHGPVLIRDSIKGDRPIIIGVNQQGFFMPSTSVVFGGANTNFTGAISVQSGALFLRHNQALGVSASNNVDVLQSGALELRNAVTVSGKTIFVGGSGLGDSGIIRSGNGAGACTLQSDVIVSNGIRVRALLNSVLNFTHIGRSQNLAWPVIFQGPGEINVRGTFGMINEGRAFGAIVREGTAGTPSLLRFYDSANFNGLLTISNGTLELAGNEKLPSTTPLVLASSTLRTGPVSGAGFTQTFGSIRLQSHGVVHSTIALVNSPHNLYFGPSRHFGWTAGRILNITGWAGAAGSTGDPNKGRIFVRDTAEAGDPVPGLTEQQLSQILFAGYCNGGMLLPRFTLDGGITWWRELVPSTLPYIASFGPSSTYVGTTITVNGCSLGLINSYTFKVGDSVVSPVTPISLISFSFVLKDNHSGLLSIETPPPDGGTRALPSPELVNLGYITKFNSSSTVYPWENDAYWRGDKIPPEDRPITLTMPVRCNTTVNNPNPNPPPNNDKSITINPNGALLIGPSGAIGGPTQIRLNGGSLRTFDYNSNTPPTYPAGKSITFDTLTVLANSSIALGSGAHTLRFTNSRNALWTAGRVLTIYNWHGTGPEPGGPGTPGTQGRIFVGTNASGLTETQLRNIQFVGFCQGATLLSNGELVPSVNAFINSVNAGKGGSFKAYHADTIRIIGCQFDDVKRVDIGLFENNIDYEFKQGDAANPLISDTIQIIGSNSYPEDTVWLYRQEDGTDGGYSDGVLRQLGFLMTKNGEWSDKSVWMGDTIPPVNARVTIGTDLALVSHDVLMDAAPDSVFIETGNMLQVADGTTLTINKALVINSTASFLPQPTSVLNLGGGGRIVNNGYFNSDATGNIFLHGTVNLDSSATITGTKRIYFNNLVLNKGLLKLPTKAGGGTGQPPNLLPDSIPQVNGTFTIKGGAIQYTILNESKEVGPIYADGSSLVYSTGGIYTRGVEWNSSTFSDDNYPGWPWPGLPFNVDVEGNTILDVNQSPSTQPGGSPLYLLMRGSLSIRGNSRINYSRTSPLEVNGSIVLGTGPESLDSLIFTAGAGAYLILKGGLTVHEQSGVRLPANNWIEIAGDQDGEFRTPGRTNFSIARLKLNKGSGGEFRLFSPLSISTAIDFTNGIISPMHDSIHLEIQAAASVAGGNNNSFVNGRMRKVTANTPANASSNFEFRIGKKSADGSPHHYRPVWVANMVHSGITTYTAEFFNTPTAENPPTFVLPEGDLVQAMSIFKKQWWMVEKNGSGSARVGIPYSPSPVGGWAGSPIPIIPSLTDNVAVVKYHGVADEEDWRFTKNPGNFNNTTHPYPEVRNASASGLVYSAVLSGFSPFTIGFNHAVVLPLNLLSFTAKLQNGNNAYLQWKIADANDLRHFEVEHSLDGTNFNKIGTVIAQENKEYSYMHNGLGKGIHFYRLKLVEKDGTQTYSRIEFVQVDVNQTLISGLINNPVQGNSAQLKVYSATNQMGEAAVYDMSGRLVLRQKVSLQAGQNQVPISFTVLAHGQYYLNFQTQDGVRGTLPVVW